MYRYILLAIIAVTLFGFGYSGDGSNGFVDDETVTAANMNEIDSALDGLETDVAAAESDITTNASGIATNLSSIGSLATAAASHAVEIAAGTVALATGSITANTCATANTATATGAATTDVIQFTPQGDITLVTGYGPAGTEGLFIVHWATLNTANFRVCNGTASAITAGALTLNWRIDR